VHLIHAPKKTTYIITECIEINVIKHQSIYYIAEDLIQNKRINIKRTKDRRRQMSTEKRHLDQVECLGVRQLLFDHLFFSYGGCETARVSSHTFIAQQVVGNNVA
jgi:hypothetical protein